jgi:hypothetical protein
MNRRLLLGVLFAAAFPSQACTDDGTRNQGTRDFQWRELEIPEFRETKHLTDTKVYRLRKSDEFLFVLSRGTYLNGDDPRTSYVGHVDAHDTITLTDLKEVAERNTKNHLFSELFTQDIADAHVHVTGYDSDHVWVSWTCGLDTHVCAIRSEDRGKSFDDGTFSITRATGALDSTHEPSMLCNCETDCVLTWGEERSKSTFDMYARRFTENGWCSPTEKQRIGDGLGIPLEMSTAVGNNSYLVSAVDPAWLGLKGTTLRSAHLTYESNECNAEVDRMRVVDSGFAFRSNAADGFHYNGSAGNIAPRCSIPSLPTWQIYSTGFALSAVRRNTNGEIDASARFGDPDPLISVMAGNVDFDGERFFVFYHKFRGLDHAEDPNTYSICYRSTEDAHSLNWSEESCPVVGLPGLTAPGKNFQNMIQPVGSAWHGNVSIIFQKDCGSEACTLALKRLESDPP